MPEIYLNHITAVTAKGQEKNNPTVLGCGANECERLVGKIGVHSRPIALSDEYTSDLAISAVKKLFANIETTASDVGILMVCTQTPDHLIPGVSSRLHGVLDFHQDCLVLDINQGCSGFVLGTQTITALMQNSARPGILVNADTYSRLIRPEDVTTRVLFGDAAAASYFSTKPEGLRVVYCRSFADGKGYNAFVARNSGLRKEEGVPAGIYMDGSSILSFALRAVPEAINKALNDNSLTLRNIRKFVFHQANSFVIGQIAYKLGLSQEQVPQNCAELGNTVSASVPLLLTEQMCLLEPGDFVMTIGFGVGLSWGVSLFQRV